MQTLATTTDLANRNIDISDPTAVAAFLESASAAVRDAAGVPISTEMLTVTVSGDRDVYLTLPGPVREVTSVTVDGEAVDDWRIVDGRLWRRCGWSASCEPSEVVVAFTCGYDPIPADIVDLVCSMVGAALNRLTEGGYESRGDLISTRIDDYSEQYASDVATRSAGPMELPPLTRERLRERFSSDVHVVGSR